jgi:hypothetical protein
MDQREILFGKRISRLRREIAELETDLLVLAGLHTYSPTMDQYDVRASVRDLTGATEAARTILTKLESINRS